jgi:chaperone required for assembly of F1-ATPase
MKTIEMPMLSLSRTAVDADIEGHLSEHLKNTIYEYLKTDTLLFYE